MNYFNQNQQMRQPYTNLNQYCFVNGFEGAKAFQMLPNQTMLLMDSDKPNFYIKTSNNLGQSTIEAYEFKKIETQEEVRTEYATKQDLQEIKDLIASIKGENK